MPSLTYEISVTGPGLDVVHCASVSPPITTDHGPARGGLSPRKPLRRTASGSQMGNNSSR